MPPVYGAWVSSNKAVSNTITVIVCRDTCKNFSLCLCLSLNLSLYQFVPNVSINERKKPNNVTKIQLLQIQSSKGITQKYCRSICNTGCRGLSKTSVCSFYTIKKTKYLETYYLHVTLFVRTLPKRVCFCLPKLLFFVMCVHS